MAYRIFLSGLMVFVEHGGFKQVDVLLLNPCADDHKPGEGVHEGASHERECLDRHLPQLTVKATDMAEWNLSGTLHGCGSRHFDLTGKTVFANIDRRTYKERAVDHTSKPELDPYPVDPFGDMRHVSFAEGIVDMRKVLGPGKGTIDGANLKTLLKGLGTNLIAAKVRLPQGTLTALAPLDNSVRQVVKWNIGAQKDLIVMCETAMFEPFEQDNRRIDLGDGEYVQLKNRADVTVWITDEPRVRNRFQPEGKFPGVLHFHHYYALLPVGTLPVMRMDDPDRPLPGLDKASFNIDTPPCPQCLMDSDSPLD